MIDCSTRSVRKAIIGAARALCSGATRRGKALEFTQLVVHGDAVAVNAANHWRQKAERRRSGAF